MRAHPSSSTSSPSRRTSGTPTPNLTLNYGLRYDYYTPLKVQDDLIVKFNIETGTIDPNTTPLHGTKKNNFQPRVSVTYAPGKTVFRGGFGVFVGPGQGEDLIQPIESDRVSTTLSTGPLLAYPDQPGRCWSPTSPTTRTTATTSRAPTRTEYDDSREGLPVHGVGAAGAGRQLRRDRGLRRQPGPQPVPAQRRATRSSRWSPTRTRRARRSSSASSRSSQRDAAGNVTGVQNPYAEVDFKTSGGHDSYNAMMLSLNRRSAQRPRDERAVHARPAAAARRAARTRRTRPPTTRARSSEFDYDNGYNNFDVRHTFNLSLLYSLPYGRGRKYGSDASALTQALLGGWDVGGIVNARSGLPVQVQIVRPDIVYRDARRAASSPNPAAGRDGGHQHAGRRRVAQRAPARPRARRRSVHQGRRPAVPEPGRVRDAGAGHVRQPGAQLDPRPELQAGRLLLRQALRHSAAAATSSSASKCSTCSTR